MNTIKTITSHTRTLAVATLSLCAAGLSTLPAQEAPWENALPVEDGDYILYIGNSLGGGVLDLLRGPTFTEEGVNLNTALLYKGGQPLERHYEDENNLTPAEGGADYNGKNSPPESLRDRELSSMEQVLHGASVTENAIGNNPADGHRWDVVILQDWRDDLRDYDRFAYYVRRFDQSIRKQGGQTVLFSRFAGRPKEGKIDGYLSRLAKIDESNVRMAKEIGADVVPISKIYIEIEKARQANAALPDDDPAKKDFLPDDTENLFMDEHDGTWFEPGFLYGDGIHHGWLAKSSVYPYAFYSILRRQSPVGKPGAPKGWRMMDITKHPELHEWTVGMVWDVIREREPWAGNPSYEPPQRNGQVTARYDSATGHLVLTIEGAVKGIRLGSPGKQLMTPDSVGTIGDLAPVDADAELFAWVVEDGTLPAGEFDLGQVAAVGTEYAELFFAYTPEQGAVGEIEMTGTGGLTVVCETAAPSPYTMAK